MAPRKERTGEDNRLPKITKKKSRLFPLQKDIQEFRRCRSKRPPLTPTCSHNREELECNRVTQDDVKRFYDHFHQTQEREAQDLVILSHCEVRDARGSRARTAFFLPTAGGRMRVCKAAFTGALAVGVARIHKVLRTAKRDPSQETVCHEGAFPKKKVTFAKENDYRHFNNNNLDVSPVLDSLSSSDDVFNNTFNITSKSFSKSDLSCSKADESLLKEQSYEVSANSLDFNALYELHINSDKSTGEMMTENGALRTCLISNEQNNLNFLTSSPKNVQNKDIRSLLKTDKIQNTLEYKQDTSIEYTSENRKDKLASESPINSEKSLNSFSKVLYSTPKKPHNGRFFPHMEFTWSDPKSTPKSSNKKNKINQHYPISFDWSDPKPNAKLRLNENTPLKYNRKTEFVIKLTDFSETNCADVETQNLISNHAGKKPNYDHKSISNKRKSLAMLTNVIHDIENLSLKEQKTSLGEKIKSSPQDKENIHTQVSNGKSSGIMRENRNIDDSCRNNLPTKIVRRLGKRNSKTSRREVGKTCSPVVFKPKIIL